MTNVLMPRWSKPDSILFASESPAYDKAFGFAIAQAIGLGANLVIFHANDSMDIATMTERRSHEDHSLARVGRRRLDPLAQHASDLGIRCKSVERPGVAADQILAFLHEHKVDRIVMGAHSPGPVGRLLVGSVAEAVMRNANVPVAIVNSFVVEESFRNSSTGKILCDVGKTEASRVVADFGANVACRHKANLILLQVIPAQESNKVLGGRNITQMEDALLSLVPANLRHKIKVQAKVIIGDPTEELLLLARAQQASFIVMGAQGASRFAAVSHAGIVYKVLAYAQCPVVTLSPVLLAECGANENKPCLTEVNYLAGVV